MHRLPAVSLFAALLLLAATGAAHAADPAPTGLPAPPRTEAEPNGTTATATPIASGERVRAQIAPRTDVDVYSFTAEAGDRVFAATTTMGAATGSFDSQLTLLGSDGTTVLEFDDDDGSFGPLASSIAGAPIPADGTYYLAVRSFEGRQTLRPYEIWLRLRSTAPPAEAEPNNETATATPLTDGATGEIAGSSEQDIYALELDAGDTVLLSLDLDPERDGSTSFVGLGFGGDEILPVNSGAWDDIDSEAFVASAPISRTYYVVISTISNSTATYELSATVIPGVQQSCSTYTVTPSAGDIPDFGESAFPFDVTDSGRIDRVALAVDASHTYMADLDVILEAPDGNRVPVFTDLGERRSGGPDTRLQAWFDDDAGTAPVDFLQRPAMVQPEREGRLSYFSGQRAAGTWKLIVRDDTVQDLGRLTRADLILCLRPEEGPVETVFSAGFETGADGFTHGGTGDEWERGTPATVQTARVAGLARCAEGTQCFKTDLDGTYDAASSQDLVSPPISLAGRTGPIYASWAQWYQLDGADSDHVTVSVHEDGGPAARALFEWDGGRMDPLMGQLTGEVTLPVAAGWGVHRADVSAFAGKTIRLRFHLDSNAEQELAGLGGIL